tara:strand:- start:1286 stop:2173 length:888 start_codon:yes stop_codon:yes gene_type:complete
MKTILIVGITGFLGRNLSKMLWLKYKDQFKIIGTGISPNKINQFKVNRRNWNAIENDIPCHCIDIVYDIDKLEFIFKNNKIDYIIHCAALKYIDIAEKDPSKCIDINIIGTKNIITLANKYNVDNLIALSTDKANTPINTYGMSKYLMEQMILQYNYSIYQGVNFFWSDGSVLDIWYRQIKKNENLCITDLNQERYYSRIESICEDLINNISHKNSIITPTKIFKIKLCDLFESLIQVLNYDTKKSFIMGYRDNEKQIEILHDNQNLNHEIPEYNKEDIIKLINKTLKDTDISCL